MSSLFPHTVFTGGTRVPVAQAESLGTLGHDVMFFGGYMGRAPGPRVVVTEVSGVPSRLVDVAGRLDPEDTGFFVNESAEDELRRLLRTSRFDVVHFHSLQGLGSSLITVARDAGVPTVVQMHDFFWVCDRQFLVTKDLSACSGLEGPGCTCPHARGAPTVRSQALDLADAVLVPTEEMRRWLANTGLGAAHVQVGGWPAPELPPAATETEWDTSEPYLLYLGGVSSEKGWPTLLLAGWGDDSGHLRILCPGVASRSIPWELQDRFIGGPRAARDEVALLMREARGVLVPSLAAETFSYVAREALALGTPVAITDGPGGVDCWRGFPDMVHLIPRGRPDHLRSAMGTLLGATRPTGHRTPTQAWPELGSQLVDIYSRLAEGASS